MPLWGTTPGTKPKWLTADEKKEVFATSSGYVVEGGSTMTGCGNPDAQPEVLVAIGELAKTLGSALITQIELITPLAGGTFDKSDGGNISVRVRFNEQVDVTGTPNFVVNNITDAARHQTCPYASGTGTNELVFTKTLAGGSSDINDGDSLNVIDNPLALNGGTIKDKTTAENATITSDVYMGDAAGGFTCVA